MSRKKQEPTNTTQPVDTGAAGEPQDERRPSPEPDESSQATATAKARRSLRAPTGLPWRSADSSRCLPCS